MFSIFVTLEHQIIKHARTINRLNSYIRTSFGKLLEGHRIHSYVVHVFFLNILSDAATTVVIPDSTFHFHVSILSALAH